MPCRNYIQWIAAHSPQAKGRIERLLETLQDRLVKELRLAGVATAGGANHFLEEVFLPFWEERFTVLPRQAQDAPRRRGREHRLEQVLAIREPGYGASDYTVRWRGEVWAIPRAEVRAGLRGARMQVEQRLDGSLGARFRDAYLTLQPCPAAARFSTSPSGPPLEEDISIWQKSGHFYFALTVNAPVH